MNYTDQIGNTIRLAQKAQRIVSLVPSQTELLYDLGLGDKVVGITKFCVHPNQWFQSKTRVGGTKNVKFEVIEELAPDLIIANKEENSKEDIERLQSLYNVWTSDIFTVDDALEMMKAVGELTGTTSQANELVKNIEQKRIHFQQMKPVKMLYLIWREPYMLAGANTFITNFLAEIGLVNLASQLEDDRYPIVDFETINKLHPDVLLCSSEPYPFKDEHLSELTENTGVKAMHIDGEYCSWYGSRLLKAYDYFEGLKMTLD